MGRDRLTVKPLTLPEHDRPHVGRIECWRVVARAMTFGVGYQQLVRHLATNAADAYGLRNRGRLAPGWPPTSVSSDPAG